MTLSDTTLVMLAAAAQRADRGIEIPARLKGAAAARLAKKLQGEGLIEAVRARGSLPVWRRDEDNRAIALRITKAGLKAIRVEEAEAGTEAAARPAPTPGLLGRQRSISAAYATGRIFWSWPGARTSPRAAIAS